MKRVLIQRGMGKRAEQAVNNHRSWISCSGSVLCAFADEAGLTQDEAKRMAAPFAGGRMGKCGAVMAAERVLEEKFGGEQAQEMIQRLEAAFIAKNRSVDCRALRGLGLRPCRGCVKDAAEILEEMLTETD